MVSKEIYNDDNTAYIMSIHDSDAQIYKITTEKFLFNTIFFKYIETSTIRNIIGEQWIIH